MIKGIKFINYMDVFNNHYLKKIIFNVASSLLNENVYGGRPVSNKIVFMG